MISEREQALIGLGKVAGELAFTLWSLEDGEWTVKVGEEGVHLVHDRRTGGPFVDLWNLDEWFRRQVQRIAIERITAHARD